MATIDALRGPTLMPASGKPATSIVVLLHGYGSNGDDLIGLAPFFARILPETAFRALRPGTETAAAVLNKYLDQVLDHHTLDAGRLALLGFSQGTMMALHVGLRREKQIGGILGYSGALTGSDRLAAEIKSKPPVALVHGDADQVVPFGAMGEAEKALASVGVKYESHRVRGLQHGIDGEGAEFGAAFLKKVIG